MSDIMITEHHQMVYAQLLQWSHMLSLEINTGMKHSRRSPMAEARGVELVIGETTYSFNFGTKRNVLKALVKAITAINPDYQPGGGINRALGGAK